MFFFVRKLDFVVIVVTREFGKKWDSIPKEKKKEPSSYKVTDIFV